MLTLTDRIRKIKKSENRKKEGRREERDESKEAIVEDVENGAIYSESIARVLENGTFQVDSMANAVYFDVVNNKL